MILDVGGGSTEFMIGQGEHPDYSRSFPLGSVRLMEMMRPSDPPTVAELAAELGMSHRTLSRHIKDATGRSVSALLQSVRLHRARLLLESSRMSVEQVAAQVGYADTTALRRLMRKITRATPTQFRTSVFEHRRNGGTLAKRSSGTRDASVRKA